MYFRYLDKSWLCATVNLDLCVQAAPESPGFHAAQMVFDNSTKSGGENTSAISTSGGNANREAGEFAPITPLDAKIYAKSNEEKILAGSSF